MKLAIAAFTTSLLIATGASAMIGTYERAVENAPLASDLFTQGKTATVSGETASSPGADWSNGEARTVTVFETDSSATDHFGADAR